MTTSASPGRRTTSPRDNRTRSSSPCPKYGPSSLLPHGPCGPRRVGIPCRIGPQRHRSYDYSTAAMIVHRSKICVIASAHNDAPSIGEFARRLIDVFERVPAYAWEAIIVDNGSQDDTFPRIESVLDTDARFKTVQLARNFQSDGGFTAGLAIADADAVVLMHADLEDPPEMIPDFVAKWEAGFENVYASEAPGANAGAARSMKGRLLSSLSGKLMGSLVPSGSGDYRLLDRRVYEQVRDMEERNRFVQGLVAWAGFRSYGVERQGGALVAHKSEPRENGRIHHTVKRVFAHSQVPIVVIPLIGVGLAALAFLALIAFSIDWLTRGVPFPGFGTIVTLMIMLFGLLFCMLGIVSIYIGLIYEETKGRPNFVIRRTVGFDVRDGDERAWTSANTGQPSKFGDGARLCRPTGVVRRFASRF